MAALSSSGFEIAVRPGLFRSLIGLGLVAGTALFSGSGCREESRGVPPAASPVPEAPPPPPPEDPPDEPPDEPPAAPPPVIFTEKDQAEMVYVAAGEFLMGTSEADVELYADLFPLRPASAFDDERPQRAVDLDAFYIDRLEVTNRQFQRFLADSGYRPAGYLNVPPHNAAELPAPVFAWEDAAAYAAWAGKRLPTEAEWEKAARGTDGRIWPWGNEWDPTRLSGNDGTGLLDGYTQTASVGQFPRGASPCGALDMAGNVWEWVSDWYRPDAYLTEPVVNPKGPETGDGHVLRGGGWAESFDFTRCANRRGGNPGSLIRGFRCAMDVPEE